MSSYVRFAFKCFRDQLDEKICISVRLKHLYIRVSPLPPPCATIAAWCACFDELVGQIHSRNEKPRHFFTYSFLMNRCTGSNAPVNFCRIVSSTDMTFVPKCRRPFERRELERRNAHTMQNSCNGYRSQRESVRTLDTRARANQMLRVLFV